MIFLLKLDTLIFGLSTLEYSLIDATRMAALVWEATAI